MIREINTLIKIYWFRSTLRKRNVTYLFPNLNTNTQGFKGRREKKKKKNIVDE